MSYNATVYRILIASPSDVAEEREITSRLIQNWNDVNSFSKKIVLLPLKWETHSSPTYDIRPQEAINSQLVDSADLVIGLFWAKVGSDTGLEISGTIEEIKRAANNGKDVMIYFSKRGIDPSEINIDQLTELNKFKQEVYKNALVENFHSVIDFRDKLTRQLEYKIRELQKNNNEARTKLNISFINQKTNELLPEDYSVEVDWVNLSGKRVNEIIKSNKDIGDRASEFKNDIVRYAEKINSLPVVLGIHNADNIIHSGVNVDLQVSESLTDTVVIDVVGVRNDGLFHPFLFAGKLNSEDSKNINSLYNETLEKVDPNTMNVHTESLTILPNRIKCIKPVIILRPKKTVEVEFRIKILSNTLLESISKKLILKITVNPREIRQDEISEIIEKLSDEHHDDDIPF